MVPNLPYFMVQFDHKGEKGYGHVIEGTGDGNEEDGGLEEGEKGGGDFPRYEDADFYSLDARSGPLNMFCLS